MTGHDLLHATWLRPIVSSLGATALVFGALGLAAITDKAALTCLGSLIEGMSNPAKYMLVAGRRQQYRTSRQTI